MAPIMRTPGDDELITQLTSRQRMQGKRAIYILDRFRTCPIYREAQLAIGWDEAFCAYYDKLSEEDHTYLDTTVEHRRLETIWN